MKQIIYIQGKKYYLKYCSTNRTNIYEMAKYLKRKKYKYFIKMNYNNICIYTRKK